MAEIVKSLSLDVAVQNRIQAILAKQYDKDSRFLQVQLTDNGEPIYVESSSVVTINAARADGESKAFACVVNADGTLKVPITYWMLVLDDKVSCDVSVVDAQGRKLSTLNFTIEVEHANYSGDDISQDENYDLLVSLLTEVAGAIDAEAQRVVAEQARVDAENQRVASESVRNTAETQRSTDEETRIANENTRKSNETSRKSAETLRKNAETARVDVEKSRVNAETARISAESTRSTNEEAREQAETGRASAETGRATTENQRVENETARQTAETARANAENERAAAEYNRAAAWVEAEGIRQIVIEDTDNNKQYGYQLKITGGKPKLHITDL